MSGPATLTTEVSNKSAKQIDYKVDNVNNINKAELPIKSVINEFVSADKEMTQKDMLIEDKVKVLSDIMYANLDKLPAEYKDGILSLESSKLEFINLLEKWVENTDTNRPELPFDSADFVNSIDNFVTQHNSEPSYDQAYLGTSSLSATEATAVNRNDFNKISKDTPVILIGLYVAIAIMDMNLGAASLMQKKDALFQKVMDDLSALLSFTTSLSTLYKATLSKREKENQTAENKDTKSTVDWDDDELDVASFYDSYVVVDSKPKTILIPEDQIDNLPPFIRKFGVPATAKVDRHDENLNKTMTGLEFNPNTFNAILQQVSMELTTVLLDSSNSTYGKFDDVEEGSMTNSERLNNLMQDITNKLKLVTDKQSSGASQIGIYQNNIDGGKRFFDTILNIVQAFINKL